MNDTAPAGIGHNLPPEPIDPHKAIIARVQERIDAANIWLAQVTAIRDIGTAQACDDFITQIGDEWDRVDGERKVEKEPHDKKAAEVQAFFKPLLEKLELADKKLKPLRKGWLDHVEEEQREEAARLQREADEKARAEAELLKKAQSGTGDVIGDEIAALDAGRQAREAQQAANRAALARPTVRGEFARKATGYRTVWSAKITDPLKALRYYRNNARLLATLKQIADEDARRLKDSGHTVPGVEFVSTRT